MMVANCVSSLGMDVSGYDLFISVNNEWNFSVGHVYSEIDHLLRMQKLINKYCKQ
mgnify:CR=1 FL=1